MGLAVSLPKHGEIDLPYVSESAYNQLTVAITHQQVSAVVDRNEDFPKEIVDEVLSKTSWWLQVQTEVLYAQWPRATLTLLKAAYDVVTNRETAA